MFYLHLLAIGALLVLVRVAVLLCVSAMCDCVWCAPRFRWDGISRPPWWAPWCLRCRGRRQHFRLGARTVRRVRIALRLAWREEQVRRAVRRAGGRS